MASNPSAKSPDNSALHPITKSRKILNSWIQNLPIDPIFINVSDEKTINNKPLSKANMLNNLMSLQLKIANVEVDKIVALGDTASRALSLIGQPHIRIEHPSGLNRKLNDPNIVKNTIETLKQISTGIK